MAKNLLCYESEDKSFITQIGFIRIAEVLYIQNKSMDKNGEFEQTTLELATSNEEIIKLRDFLNSLKLSDINDRRGN